MKKSALIGLSVVVAATVIVSVFVGVSGISSHFNSFFASCINLSEGMTKDEARTRMQIFLGSKDYQVVESGPGNYGWLDRLSYDDSLTIILQDEPWYKLDQHPWQCKLLFKDGAVVSIDALFD
jgi:hypothetical protein